MYYLCLDGGSIEVHDTVPTGEDLPFARLARPRPPRLQPLQKQQRVDAWNDAPTDSTKSNDMSSVIYVVAAFQQCIQITLHLKASLGKRVHIVKVAQANYVQARRMFEVASEYRDFFLGTRLRSVCAVVCRRTPRHLKWRLCQ